MAEAQLDHRQLRRREGEQDAEAVEAGEEEDRMGERGRCRHEQGDRDQRRSDDRLRGDDRAPAEPPEDARQLSVLAERVGEAAEPRDRSRRRRHQDQRSRRADEDL